MGVISHSQCGSTPYAVDILVVSDSWKFHIDSEFHGIHHVALLEKGSEMTARKAASKLFAMRDSLSQLGMDMNRIVGDIDTINSTDSEIRLVMSRIDDIAFMAGRVENNAQMFLDAFRKELL